MTQAPQFDALVTDPVFPVTFRAFSEGQYGHGVIGIAGLEATAGAGDWEIDIASGEVQYDGSRYSLAAADTLTIDQPGADPRWDVVYFDTATETAGVKKGTPGAAPIPEDIGDGEVLIAYVEVDPSMPSLTDEDIRNWRSRPQPAMNVPLDHPTVDGDTVEEGFTWVANNATQSPHDNSDHDPNFSEEGHDHSGESLGQTNALQSLATLVAEIGALAASLDADGNSITNVGNLTAAAAAVANAPADPEDVVRLADLQAVQDSFALESYDVTSRDELPDPANMSGGAFGYIREEDRYVGVYQE